MINPKRYDCVLEEGYGIIGVVMEESEIGEWVSLHDYTALRARLEAVEKERDRLAESTEFWERCAVLNEKRFERAETALADARVMISTIEGRFETMAKSYAAEVARLTEALATARRDALEQAAQMVEDHFPATQDMQSTMICGALEEVATAIRALANEVET